LEVALAKAEPIRPATTVFNSSSYSKIELVWPGKDKQFRPQQQADGSWQLLEVPDYKTLSPFNNIESYPAAAEWADSIVVSGDRLEVMNTLSRCVKRNIRLVYYDTPRLDVDDKAAAFKGDTTFKVTTWLVVLRSHVQAVLSMVSYEGVLVVHTGDAEEPYARLVLDELLDRENHVATIVWQRGYGPRNMRGMREFTATHDCLLVYAIRKSTLPAVGLRTAPEGFSNPDEDPRGPWKAEHKGAHSYRAKSDFNTYIPPYRWTIVEGELPKGLWRLNPLTGVIFGIPEEEVTQELRIEVTDTEGSKSEKKFELRCVEDGVQPTLPEIPWIFEEINTTGALRITTDSLPTAVVGQEYSAVCLAEGGVPFTGAPRRPGSGRYWEFADDTLIEAYQRDEVYLGRDGNAIPHPKTYSIAVGETVVKNQMTWWPGRERSGSSTTAFAGYTEDATKHLKKLAELNLISKVVNTAKPEQLIARLIEIFTNPNDVVLEVFGEAADLAAVAIKTGRRFIYLAGESDRQRDLLENCALPRLRAVVNGQDLNLEENDGEIRMRSDAYLPFKGGGSFLVCKLGTWLFHKKLTEEFPRLNRTFRDFDSLKTALITADGFFPMPREAVVDGRSLYSDSGAVVIPPDEYLDDKRAAEIVSNVKPRFDQLVIYYFRSADSFDPSKISNGVVCRRVPTEMTL
jgi:hypothetical protein